MKLWTFWYYLSLCSEFDSDFRVALQRYTSQYGLGVASTDDFWGVLQQVGLSLNLCKYFCIVHICFPVNSCFFL